MDKYVCPLCQQMMIGEKSEPALQAFDRFRCPDCGTVIEFGEHEGEPESETE